MATISVLAAVALCRLLQSRGCLKLRQEHLTFQPGKKRAFEASHDLAFDFGKMQLHIHLLQLCIECFKRFRGAEVDVFDRRTLQDDMPDIFVACDLVVDLVFHQARTREVRAFVHPEGYDASLGDHFVAQELAEVLPAGHLSELGNVTFGCNLKKQQDAEIHQAPNSDDGGCGERFRTCVEIDN